MISTYAHELKTEQSLKLQNEVDSFLKNGGQIQEIPMGRTLDNQTFNPVFCPKSSAVIEQNVQYIRSGNPKHNNKMLELAKRDRVQFLIKWCDAKKGRVAKLTEVLGCACSYISQIKNYTRTCSNERLDEIRKAMKVVEKSEKEQSQ